MKTLIAIILVPLIVLAIESMNPRSVCDRFTGPADQKSCQARVEALKPDSYLAAVCQKQFEDSAFWNCMELSKTASFDARKLDLCTGADINDQQRFNCLKEIAQAPGKNEFQPASASGAKERQATEAH
jgi:hypothetical protein